MTVYLPKGRKTYVYDFWQHGTRHRDTTHQTRREDAELVEAKVRLRLRQQLAGIAPVDPSDTPRFHDWAEVYLKEKKRRRSRPDLIKRTLLIVLEFWGARPARPRPKPAVVVPRALPPAPYHDLRLGDPIADATWLRKFDEWIDARRVSGSTRNTYLSVMSGMYRTALTAKFRADTHVDQNPFRDLERSPRRARVIALEPATVLAWIQAASYHVALAVTIAALAPKLRLQTILGLTWKEHFDRGLTRITVYQHKTAATSGAPQVTPISTQLREILRDAQSRSASAYVINFRSEGVDSIKKGTRRAAEAVGLTWGVSDGVTFHTLRHSIATLLAKQGMPERLRMELMGHKEIRTTQQYTHLAAEVQVEPHEQLSAALPLRDTLLNKPRPRPTARGENRGDSRSRRTKTGRKSRNYKRVH